MNAQRNRSKASRKKGWPYDSIGGIGSGADDRRARLAATKKNSKRKRLQAKYARPKETPALIAQRVEAAKESARKVFERFLNSADARKIAAAGNLPFVVRCILAEGMEGRT